MKHSDRIKKCPEEGCKYSTSTPRRMENHLRREHKKMWVTPATEGQEPTETKPLDKMLCQQCAFSCYTERELQKHVERRHQFRKCPEEGCDFGTTNGTEMASHRAMMHRLRCGICNFVPGWGKTLSEHRCEDHLGK